MKRYFILLLLISSAFIISTKAQKVNDSLQSNKPQWKIINVLWEMKKK